MDVARIRALADAHAPRAIEWRRHLHANPELSFQERGTSAFVRARLAELAYAPAADVGVANAVVARLDGGRSGPTLALRADIDALPIAEATGLPFASRNAGVMHACGHDAHTAVLLGAAAALAEIRSELPGRLVLLFQPAEELAPGGALPMIEAGALEGVAMAFALHQAPELDAGEIAVHEGPRNGSADAFELRVLGRSSHAARPERGADAIAIAAELVVALQQIVSRHVDPMQPAVVTIGTIRGGTKENIIAPEVALTGTIRAQDEEVRDEIPRLIERIADGVTRAHGAAYAFALTRGYPVLVNDRRAAAVARRAAERVVGAERVKEERAAMYGEDFAYVAQRVPACMIGLGSGTPGSPRPRPGSHTEKFVLDEACIETGIAWYVAAVFAAAEELAT